MWIGVPKEIKNHEYRVGLTPEGVRELCIRGHQVVVQAQAGLGIGFTDADYLEAGAEVVAAATEVFSRAELIVKVKEPQPQECALLQPRHCLFTYLHLAADPAQAQRLLDSGATCIAYETVTDGRGGLPLLAPMSEVAGRMAVQAGAHHLEKTQGGMGVLLAGVPGVAPAQVVIIGGGVVGTQAARTAVGMGADVTVLDRSLPRLRELDTEFGGRLRCVYSSEAMLERYVLAADLVIGAVLVPGAAAPKLLDESILRRMKNGAVLVDVAIDQGGCFATSRPTTHEQPTYVVEGIIHYCVANIPGAVAKTSTMALTHATLPYVQALASKGVMTALRADPGLANGLNICAGRVTHPAVAQAMGCDVVRLADVLAS